MGEIRIHGRGGQGSVVAAEWLAAAFVLDGKYVASFPSFGQERGASRLTPTEQRTLKFFSLPPEAARARPGW